MHRPPRPVRPPRPCPSPTRDRVRALVNAHPAGVTTAEVAAILEATLGYACTQLSRLAAYGEIGRQRIPRTGNGPNFYYLWKPKEEATYA